MNARSQLFRLLRVFFEQHLRSFCTWGDVQAFPAENVDPVEKGLSRARFPYGKVKEIVAVRFKEFDLTISSPNEAPPLGRLTIGVIGGSSLELASLDQAAWKMAGEFVTKHKQEIDCHG